jgi:hypothetical protein
MPLTLDEVISLANRHGALAYRAKDALFGSLDQDVSALLSLILDAISAKGPGRRRITKDERIAILESVAHLYRHLQDPELADLLRDLHDLANDVLREAKD